MRLLVRIGVGAVTIAICWLLAPGSAIPQSSGAEEAHRNLEMRQGQYRYQTEDDWVEITDVTNHCLKCHERDGSSAQGTSNVSGPATGFHQRGGRDHPVDIQYPTTRRGYRPADTLDDRLTLVEGRLTCLTCHASTPDRSTVLPNTQGRLCTACHLK